MIDINHIVGMQNEDYEILSFEKERTECIIRFKGEKIGTVKVSCTINREDKIRILVMHRIGIAPDEAINELLEHVKNHLKQLPQFRLKAVTEDHFISIRKENKAINEWLSTSEELPW